MKIHSIRTRLIIGTSLAIAVILTIGTVVIYRSMSKSLLGQLDSELEQTLSLVAPELEITGDTVDNEWLSHLEDDPLRKHRDLIQTWDSTTGVVTRSPALGEMDLPKLGGEKFDCTFETIILEDGHKVRVIGARIFPTPDTSSDPKLVPEEHPQMISLALNTNRVDKALRRLLRTLIWGAIVSILGSLGAIYLVTRFSLRPIKRVEDELISFDVHDPQSELRKFENVPDEVAGMVREYRGLLERIAKARTRERDFSANAAHELRTPLAGILATLEQATAKPRESEDYLQRIEETLNIVRPMQKLVGRLMHFTRLQSGTEPISMGPVNIHALMAERICLLEKRIERRGLVIEENLIDPDPIVSSDESLLSILICNLIENSVSHAPENSTIEVKAFFEGENGRVEITNRTLPGEFPDLEKIFNPFYRQDLARKLDENHCGIGLALSREIATTLGLRLEVVRREDGCFLARLIF